MNCTDCQDLLLDLAYGELAPDQAAAVLAHAQGCAACGPELAKLQGALRAVSPLVTALQVEEQPRAGFDDELLAAAREAVQQRAAASAPVEPARAQVISLDSARLKRRGWLRAAVGVSVAVAAGLALVVSSTQTGPPLKLAEEPAPAAAKASPAPALAVIAQQAQASKEERSPQEAERDVAEKQASGVRKKAAPERAPREKAKREAPAGVADALDDSGPPSGGGLGALSGAGGAAAGLGAASNAGGARGAVSSAPNADVAGSADKDVQPSKKRPVRAAAPPPPPPAQQRQEKGGGDLGLALSPPRSDDAGERKDVKREQAAPPAEAKPAAPAVVVVARSPGPVSPQPAKAGDSPSAALESFGPPPKAESRAHTPTPPPSAAPRSVPAAAAPAKVAVAREEAAPAEGRASPLAIAEIHEQQAASTSDPAAAARLWLRAGRLRSQAGDTEGAARDYSQAVEGFAVARLPDEARQAYDLLAALAPAQPAALAKARAALEGAVDAERARKAAKPAAPAAADADKATGQGY